MKKISLFIFLASLLFGYDSFKFSLKNDLTLGATREELFNCSPKIKGIFNVVSSQDIEFYPDKPLPLSTNFNCTFNGKKFNFQTQEFKSLTQAKLDKDTYFVSFNSKISYSDIKRNLTVISMDVNREFLDYEITMVKDTDFIFKIKNPKNLNYEFKISKNLQNMDRQNLKSDVIFNTFANSSLNLDKLKSITINTATIESISQPGNYLGFRLYFNDYFFVPSDMSKFVVINGVNNYTISSDYIIRDDKEVYYVDITSREFKPNTYYDVVLQPGFGNNSQYYGGVLKEPINFKFKTIDFYPSANFEDNKPYISSNGKILINSINLKNIEVIVSKISDENIRYFLNFGANIDASSFISSKKFDIDYIPNEKVNSQIDLDFGDRKDGIYLVEIAYKNIKNEISKVSKIVYLSDIAINTKLSSDEIFVFLNSLSTNKIIQNAKVTLYSDKNQVIASGFSDNFGIFKYNEKSLIKHKPKSIYVEFNQQKNFLILDDLDNIKHGSTNKAFIYLASEILRPNMPLKGIIIVKDGYRSIADLPLRVDIFNPNNKKVFSKNYTLDSYGSVKLDLNTTFELSGSYNINVVFENKIINSKKFNVESFVPQMVKNEIVFEKDSYFIGENILLNLSANYLFGQIANDLNGEVFTRIINKKFYNDKFKNFSFSNIDENFDYTVFDKTIPVKLDKNGRSSVVISPTLSKPAPSILTMQTTFMVNDNGKQISTYSQKDIYPYKSMVGIYTESNFYTENDKVKFKFIRINPQTLENTDTKISAILYQNSWNYNYSDNGYLDWNKEVSEVGRFDIKDDYLEIPNIKPGNYTLVAIDENSTHKSAVEFDIGGDNYGINPTKQLDFADIKLDKSFYAKDDTIKAIISSPIKEGLMLVTLEENGVKDFKVIDIKNYSANVEFKIKDDFNGMYLDAKILRITDKPASFLPFKATKKVYIQKDNIDNLLELDLNLTKQIKSGEKMVIDVKTEPNSKVYLFAADEGILQIVNQKSPAVFSFFNKQFSSLVHNFDIYDNLTNFKNPGKVLSFGSGDMLKNAMEKFLDPVKDKNQETFIKMQELNSDSSGNARFYIDVPENLNTKIRIDVIALNGDKISSKNDFITVKDDIIIKPSSISYLIKGDKVSLPISVFNNTQKELKISLDINSTPNLVIAKKDFNLIIDSNSRVNVDLEVEAKGTGDGSIGIKNSLNSNIANLNINILYPFSPSVSSYSGILTKQEEMDFSKEQGVVNVAVTDSMLALFNKDLQNLISYPHGCSEQRSSKLLALLYIKPKKEMDLKDRNNFIVNAIKNILSLQMPNGAFKYFASNSEINQFASIYTTHTLFTLNNSGFEVPKNNLDLSIDYLDKSVFNNDFLNTYAAFVLSENKSLTANKLNMLYDQKRYKTNIISLYMMAAILKNANKEDELKNVLNEIEKYDINLEFNDSNSENFDSYIRNLAFALYIHNKYFDENDVSKKITDILIKNKDKISSTQERAFVLMAFSKYINANQEPSKYTVKVENDNYELSGDSYLNIKPNLDNFKITIVPKSGKPYFSLVSYNFYDKNLRHDKNNKPLDIFREFVDTNGNKVDLQNLKLNDLVFSKITINAYQYFDDVLVYEKAPSCLEIINERIVQNIRTANQQDSVVLKHKELNDYSITSFLEPIFADRAFIFYTPYKAVLKGKCMLPDVMVETMYNESVNDYDLKTKEIIIK